VLKIANWNIERALPTQRRTARILSHLKDWPAEITILTETHQDICPGVNQNGVHSGTPDRPCKDAGERWCSIWSRFPLDDLNSYISDKARCTAARLNHPVYGTITVFSFILPWLSDKWRNIPTKGGECFGEALNLYRQDWQNLRSRFPADTFILAGDFNQSLVDHRYYGSKIQKAILEETLKSDGLLPLTAYENDPVARDSFPKACIDHICINKSAGMILQSSDRWPDTATPDKTLSDHFGIIVTLKGSNPVGKSEEINEQ
jgi:hypothetical protein